MELTILLAYVFAWLATLAFLLSTLVRRPKPNLPPGPKPWPIIGNLHQMGSLVHHTLFILSQKYGPIMYLQFGTSPVVVASSVDMAKAILKTHDQVFASRPKTTAGIYTSYNGSDITWSPYGPYWRLARKLCVIELLSAKRLDSTEHIRVEELKALVKTIYAASSKPMVLKDHLATLSLNIISRMVIGKKYPDESTANDALIPTEDEFKKMITELFLLGGVLNIGDWIPWMSSLDLQGYVKRMKVLSKKFDKFWEYVLDEHNERRRGVKDYVAKDMLDVYLQLSEDPNADVKIQSNDIKAIIQDLITAATESSAATVEWAMSEILKKPDIFNKAVEELDKVVGKERWVSEKDMSHLPYIEAIVKETMRVHPVSPLLVPRLSLEDCRLDAYGYDIPKGTQVLINVWAIGRDPTIWDRPNQFCPERFVGKSIDVKGNDFELLPFGSGRRLCPGYGLGLKVVQQNLANLLHGFTWKLPGNMLKQDLDMEEIFSLATLKKVPLLVVAEPRLPASSYLSYIK